MSQPFPSPENRSAARGDIIIHPRPGDDEPDRPFRALVGGTVFLTASALATSSGGWATLTQPGPPRYRLVGAALETIGQAPVIVVTAIVGLLLLGVGLRELRTWWSWRHAAHRASGPPGPWSSQGPWVPRHRQPPGPVSTTQTAPPHRPSQQGSPPARRHPAAPTTMKGDFS